MLEGGEPEQQIAVIEAEDPLNDPLRQGSLASALREGNTLKHEMFIDKGTEMSIDDATDYKQKRHSE